MAIDMSTVKEIHYNNKEIKKIEMNGSIVWQKPNVEKQITITYLMGFYGAQTPATKTVTTTGGVYALTSSDLPTLTLATGYYTDGWTLDGSTKLTAGTQISDNITLKAIHKVTVSNKYDWTAGKATSVAYRKTGTATSTHSVSLWNLKTASAGTYTTSYSKSWTNSIYSDARYVKTSIRGFNGVVVNFQIYKDRQFKIHWSPAVTSVTFTRNSWTQDGNYPSTYPMILVRDGNQAVRLYGNGNVTSGTITSTITSSSSNNAYIGIQYGGWDTSGGGKAAWIRQYKQDDISSSIVYPNSNHTGNVTDNIYIYMQ